MRTTTGRGASEPEPWRSVGASRVSPLLLTCEHASNRLPRRCGPAGSGSRVLASHWGWDPGAWDLTREIARRLGAAACGGRWSRLVIDLNRMAGDPTLIRSEVNGEPVPWNLRLDAAEIERRLLAYYVPYHAEVERRILRHLARGMRPLLLSIHSFTPELDGARRPFDAGVLHDRDGRLAGRLIRALRDRGLVVRRNEPYSGLDGMMYSAHRHGGNHGLPCLELEVNQALFERQSGAARLGTAVARALAALPSERSA